MNITVVGPGALGVLLAWKLSRHHDVSVVVKRERLERLRERGLTVEDAEGGRVEANIVTEVPRDSEVVFLCVKSFDLESVLPLLNGRHVPVVFPQNGIAHLNMVKEKFSENGVLMAVTYGASSVRPGVIRAGGEGVMELSSFAPTDRLVQETAYMLRKGGLNAKVAGSPEVSLWRKTGVNCCINPLTAVLECENGTLLRDPGLVTLMGRIAEEVERTAHGYGIAVSDVHRKALSVCRKTAKNRSSMLQDMEKGRRTEIDVLNLAVSKAAREVGIPTPVIDTLGNIVISKERGRVISGTSP